MGLTIHWKLKAANLAEPGKVLEGIRARAKSLPFKEIGQVLHFEGNATNADTADLDDPHRWAKIQAQDYERDPQSPREFYSVTLWPGEGCESANFMLGKYEGAEGWESSSFCKTHYAINQGLDHFLRCHLAIISILDYCKSVNILGGVNDEGDYWDTLDLEHLTRNIGGQNEQIAALAGKLVDTFGRDLIKAPVLENPDFEHIEHRGNQSLDKEKG